MDTLQLGLSFTDKLSRSHDPLTSHEYFREVKPHIVIKFWEYHRDNPRIFVMFQKFANQLKHSGRQYGGAKAIMERIRWETTIEAKGEEFKISNNYTSCYARLLAIIDPTFKDFFARKTSKKC